MLTLLLCLVRCSNPRHEHLCISLSFIIILINCIIWSMMDIFVYHNNGEIPNYYTIWAIYIPVFILFCFGYWAYFKQNKLGLLIFDIILLVIIIGLIVYSFYMFATVIWYWGFITLFFVYLLLWVLYGTWTKRKEINDRKYKPNKLWKIQQMSNFYGFTWLFLLKKHQTI